MFNIGEWVIRNCPSIIGDGSIGEVLKDNGGTYWVRIIVGKNKMQGWNNDAWAKVWCVPYLDTTKPDWEV